MKLLMTTDTIGGVWTYTIDLIKALGSYNVEILLASLGGLPSEYQKKQAAILPNTRLISSSYKLEWMHNPWDDLEKAKDWIQSIALNFKPDIVHLNSYSFNAWLFDVPVIIVGHSCVSSWWETVKEEALPSSWSQYAKNVKEALQSADIVVAPSNNMMRHLQSFYGPLSNVDVIYNAGNSSLFRSEEEKKNIIFSMGRIWDEAKNIQLLIDTVKDLDLVVFIAGDYGNKQPIDTPKNIIFPGHINKEEIANWLAVSSIFVLPSLYEPFGLSALEAAYSGCALLLSDIPSLKEIWGESALYFNPRDPLELKEKLLLLTQDENLRVEMSTKALQKSKIYQLSSMAASYFTLYSKMLAKKKNIMQIKMENH